MSRHNLTDFEWDVIRRFLPAERSGKAGRPWKSHRQVINGILFVLCTGIGWTDLPPEFGRPKTVSNRFRRWVADGLWLRIVERLIDRLCAKGEIDFELWCVDGTIVRAHRAAAGALREALSPEESAAKQGLGRSRGGYSTKIHLLTDGQGIPLGLTVTAGQRNEATEFDALFAACFINTFRKTKRPDALAADKAYSSKKIRGAIRRKQIRPVIPTRSNEARDPGFDSELYRQRNVIERAIGWLKNFRRIATRYEKKLENYTAMIHIAFFRLIVNWY